MGFKTTCVTRYELEWKVKLAEVSRCRASWTRRAAGQTPARLCRAQAGGETFREGLSRMDFKLQIQDTPGKQGMCVGGELTFTQKSREVPIIIFFFFKTERFSRFH